MRKLILTMLTCLAGYAGFAQCNATDTVYTLAPSGNSLLRVALNNTSTPYIALPKISQFNILWGDNTTSYGVWTGVTNHNYASPGTYTIKLIMSVIDSSKPGIVYCSDTETRSITVSYLPCAATYTAVPDVTNSAKYTFTANCPAGTSGITYSWNFGDGNTGTGSPVTHTYTTGGTKTVILSSTAGCTSNNSQVINVKMPVTGCSGNHANFGYGATGLSVNFINSSSNVAGQTKSSMWYFGDGGTSTANSPSHIYTTGGTYHVLLIQSWYDSVTQAFTCMDSIAKNLTLTAQNTISGDIMQDSSLSAFHVDSPKYKVWLIRFDSSSNLLYAVDSVEVQGINFSSTSNATNYHFYNKPAAQYRVKAKLLNGPTTGTSYVPTYHYSSLTWNTATTFYHTGWSVSKNISMKLGTATSGPGFVGGNVSQGANKGTTSGIEGMTILLLTSNGDPVASATTDANGDYSFNGIDNGTYNVHPEDMNYNTTPAGVTIANGQVTVTGVDFVRSNTQMSITPGSTGVININNKAVTFGIYPNPAKDKVTIQWKSTLSGHADVIVTDITGKKVFSTTVTTGTDTELNLSGLQKGMYFITVASEKTQSVQKLMLQ